MKSVPYLLITLFVVLFYSTAFAEKVVIIPLGGDTTEVYSTINWRGEWETGIEYAIGDGIQNHGSSYICIFDHTSSHEAAPPHESHWSLLASKGEVGDQGPDGATGPQGPAGAQGPEGPPGTTVFSELTGQATDAQIPNTIARDNELHARYTDSEAVNAILATDGASSGLDADLLDGNDSSAFMSSSTDYWVNTTGDVMSGSLTVNNTLRVNASLYVGTDDGSDNDYIYFDTGVLEHLKWDDGNNKFHFTDDLSITGTLMAGANTSDTPTGYNRFGQGSASHTASGEVTNAGDVWVSDDLEVDGNIYADSNIEVVGEVATSRINIGSAEYIEDGGSYKLTTGSNSFESDGYSYTTTKTGYLSIPAIAFHPSPQFINVPDHDFLSYDPRLGFAFMARSSYLETPPFLAEGATPVNLPNSVIVRRIDCFVGDTTSTGFCDGKIQLLRKSFTAPVHVSGGNGDLNATPFLMGEVILDTTEADNSLTPFQRTQTNIADERIDNNSNRYWLYLEIRDDTGLSQSGIHFEGCRIVYDVDSLDP